MFDNKNLKLHFLAIATVIIWGTTFVSTKILINNGLSPVEIFFIRFFLAYICIWFVSPKKFFADNLKDEFTLFLAGLTGGAIYFVTENTGLETTLASNASLIICTTPILTSLLFFLFNKEKLTKKFILGSLMALFGVALVVFNGSFILKINPKGDFLILLAALTWGFYCIIVKKLEKYPILFVTRKIFFYGLISLIPIFIFQPISINFNILLKPVVLFNLLFLGIVASMLCFIMWNKAMKELGTLKIINYSYITPIVALIVSYLVINEQITLIALSGCLLILSGVYVAERKKVN